MIVVGFAFFVVQVYNSRPQGRVLGAFLGNFSNGGDRCELPRFGQECPQGSKPPPTLFSVDVIATSLAKRGAVCESEGSI